MTVSTFPLPDGPLCPLDPGRTERVEAMAAGLVAFDAYHDEHDAIRCLVIDHGHRAADVMSVIDDARQVAMQMVVAREMGET